MRFITPIILIIIAGALFFMVTAPRFVDIDASRLTKVKLVEDRDNAVELQVKFEELSAQANSIKATDLAELESLLPRSVDEVDLLVKLNGIAKGSAMNISDVKIETSQPVNSRAGVASSIGSVNFRFTVTGSYLAFKQFLVNLEKSLRLVDITNLEFTAVDNGTYQYGVGLKTYWLK